MSTRLANFLFAYRNTPHTVTGETSASLFLKRSPRTKLSLIQPNLAETIEGKLKKQKLYHDSPPHVQLREFHTDEKVLVKNSSDRPVKWDKGVIEKRFGPVTYQVKVLGTSKRVHADHLVKQPVKMTMLTPVKDPVTQMDKTNMSVNVDTCTNAHRYNTRSKS